MIVSAVQSLSKLLEANVRIIFVNIEGPSQLEGFVLDREFLKERVKFIGRVENAVLRKLYSTCWLVVVPSLDEGFSIPVVEANFFRKLAVASDIEAHRELVTNLLFDPTSADDLKARLESVLDEKTYAEEFDRQGQLYVNYAPEKIRPDSGPESM